MKKIIITIITICIVIVAVCLTINIIRKNTEIPQDTSTEVSESESIIDETQSALEEIQEQGRQAGGRFWRQEKIIMGELTDLERKITYDNFRQIVDESNSFEEIVRKYEQLQEYPDFSGGIDTRRTEYWLEEDGRNKLVIYHEKELVYYESRLFNNTIYEERVNLTEDQKRQLAELWGKGDFPLQRKIIEGVVEDFERVLTLDMVKSIISESESYEEIMFKLYEVQRYYDTVYGSGVTLLQYWLNDEGTEVIVINDSQQEIYYKEYNPSNLTKPTYYETLYKIERNNGQ